MKRSISILFALASMASAAAIAAEAAPPPKSKAPAKEASAAKAAAAGKAPRAKQPKPPPKLPVAEIVSRNVAARGGLAAWRAVSSLTMTGEMDAGGTAEARLPFVMSLKRPHKNRLELTFKEQTAVQAWDGTQGWKLRPFLNRSDVESYTADEAKSAAAAAELDGPLVDFEQKGTKVELAGTEVVEGKNAYKLKLTPKGGRPLHLWVDAKSFLEVKIDGEPRRLDGRMHGVAIFYRDFRSVGGLQMPHTMETVVDKVAGSHKMTIQTIKVNPPLDESLFARPRSAPAKPAKS